MYVKNILFFKSICGQTQNTKKKNLIIRKPIIAFLGMEIQSQILKQNRKREKYVCFIIEIPMQHCCFAFSNEVENFVQNSNLYFKGGS